MGKGSEKGCGCLTAVVFALWIWFTLVLSPDSNSGVRYGAIGEFHTACNCNRTHSCSHFMVHDSQIIRK